MCWLRATTSQYLLVRSCELTCQCSPSSHCIAYTHHILPAAFCFPLFILAPLLCTTWQIDSSRLVGSLLAFGRSLVLSSTPRSPSTVS